VNSAPSENFSEHNLQIKGNSFLIIETGSSFSLVEIVGLNSKYLENKAFNLTSR
jgi:hypothetical protein